MKKIELYLLAFFVLITILIFYVCYKPLDIITDEQFKEITKENRYQESDTSAWGYR